MRIRRALLVLVVAGFPADDRLLYSQDAGGNAISPLFHAERIKKPLLVVQGKNDPRVLQVESDEIAAAVKKTGVPVEYLVFPDEGHGFQKQKNTIAAQEAYLEFLETYLRAQLVARMEPSSRVSRSRKVFARRIRRARSFVTHKWLPCIHCRKLDLAAPKALRWHDGA